MKRILNHCIFWMVAVLAVATVDAASRGDDAARQTDSTWKLGSPIVSYWAGPAINDAVAQQMTEGGFNLVWCASEQEMDVARKHGLRVQFQSPLFSPKSLDTPAERKKLDALIDRVRNHPALYSYFITDEPDATQFAALGRLVDYLRRRDPKHFAYINLLPTYANNKQLGVEGDTIHAYAEHLRQYIKRVRPSLISYDHYQFTNAGDNPHYFLNLSMIRKASMAAGLPFLNIVQASCWTPGEAASPSSPRVPNGDEMRYLVYTTLAYGAQGISYYVYCCPGHTGGIAASDGTPTPIYHAMKSFNREFTAIATELQPLESLAAYHAGMTPQGASPLPKDAPFRLDPSIASMSYGNLRPVQGMLLGYFGPTNKGDGSGKPTHVLVVNLDYKLEHVTTVVGPGKLEVFDAATRTWSSADAHAKLRLAPGGGKLVRMIP